MALRADGRRHAIDADHRRDVWMVREIDRPHPFDPSVIEPTVLKWRGIALRRQILRWPDGEYGPLEDLGFEWVEGVGYDRRVDDYRSAMTVAWGLGPTSRSRATINGFLQFTILAGLVFRVAVDDGLFGQLCWRDAVVFVEDGAPFYERFCGQLC